VYERPSYSVVPSNAVWRDPARADVAAILRKNEQDNRRRDLWFPQVMRDARRIGDYYPGLSPDGQFIAFNRVAMQPVPSPIAGILAPLASTKCMARTQANRAPLCRVGVALPTLRGQVPRSDRRYAERESGKHSLGRMGNHGEKRPRRSARHTLALLPVSDGLDRHP